MMILPILKVLKSWKVILGVVAVAGIVFAGLYYKNTYDQKVYLESQVERLNSTVEQQENDYKALEKSMVKYQSLLEENRKTNDELRNNLNEIGEQNEVVQECLDTSLPDDFINRLSE